MTDVQSRPRISDYLGRPAMAVKAFRGAWRDQTRRPLSQRWLAWCRYYASMESYRGGAPAADGSEDLHLYPCVYDYDEVMPVEPIYYFQDAWAFEKIVAAKPGLHVDIASHHKFVVLLSKVVPVTTVDIRRPEVLADSVKFVHGSILDLPFEDRSLESVSSICVVEHIGLGRYGDPLDPGGTEKALEELKRVIAPGGHLYVSMPVDDTDRVYFNAHRAYRDETWRRLFAPFELVEARYIFGKEFGSELRSGFGTGCYCLRRPR